MLIRLARTSGEVAEQIQLHSNLIDSLMNQFKKGGESKLILVLITQRSNSKQMLRLFKVIIL